MTTLEIILTCILVFIAGGVFGAFVVSEGDDDCYLD